MEDNWPLAAVVIMIAVDKVIGILKDRGIDLRKLADNVEELHKWHSKEDEDGVKVWYVRKTLEAAIDKLADNISVQTKILERMHAEDNVTRKRVEMLEAQMQRRSESE